MTTPDPDTHHNNASHHCEAGLTDQINKSISIMSAVIYSVACVLGVSGNGAVIWATGFAMEKSTSTVWYLNLAVADFLVTASLPLKIAQRALWPASYWSARWFTCKMDRLVLFVNMFASIYTLVVISVDRCVFVAAPVWARRSGYRTVRNASRVSLGVWLIALAHSLPRVVYEALGNCWDVHGLRLVVANFVAGFAVPFSVIVVCYSVIVYRLRRHGRCSAGRCGRSFKMAATVVAAFFLCWIPFHVVLLVDVCCEKGLIGYSVALNLALSFGYPVTFTLALVHSCVNPLLYVFSQRTTLRDALRCGTVLKALERAFTEEPHHPRTNNNTPTTTDPPPDDGAHSDDNALSEMH